MAERGPRLEGKIALVTGAGTREPGPLVGVGRAISVRFASEGARIVAVDVGGSPLAETVAAVEQAGSEALPEVADVTQAADVERYAAEALAKFGGIDIFFNKPTNKILKVFSRAPLSYG